MYECSRPARSGGRTFSEIRAGGDRTHIEDDEDPVELGLPSGNSLLVVPCVKNSRGRIAFALFKDLVLYFCDGSAIESMVSRNYVIAGQTHVVN